MCSPLLGTLAQQIQICPEIRRWFPGCVLADSASPPQSHSWPELGPWCKPPCRPGGVPGTGSEVNHRGLETPTGPEPEHPAGRGQGFGIFGPVEVTGLEVSAGIDPQIWAGPLVRLNPVPEVLAGLVT